MATMTHAETEVNSTISVDALYEVIDGQIVELPPMGTYPVEVATIISGFLDAYARENGIGRVLTEALIRLNTRSQKRPDVAFFSFEKWPKGRKTPRTQPFEVVPDLVIEVISETDRAGDVMEKTRDYFLGGVRAVWLVYPDLELIQFYESLTNIRVFTRADAIDGGTIIPGLRLPLMSVFQEETEGEAETPIA